MSTSASTAKFPPPKPISDIDIEQALLEFDISVRVQDKYKLFAFGLRQKQSLINKLHLRDILKAAKIIKDNFRKVLTQYRKYRSNKDLKEMFQLVNDFDKGEAYNEWLKKQSKHL